MNESCPLDRFTMRSPADSSSSDRVLVGAPNDPERFGCRHLCNLKDSKCVPVSKSPHIENDTDASMLQMLEAAEETAARVSEVLRLRDQLSPTRNRRNRKERWMFSEETSSSIPASFVSPDSIRQTVSLEDCLSNVTLNESQSEPIEGVPSYAELYGTETSPENMFSPPPTPPRAKGRPHGLSCSFKTTRRRYQRRNSFVVHRDRKPSRTTATKLHSSLSSFKFDGSGDEDENDDDLGASMPCISTTVSTCSQPEQCRKRSSDQFSVFGFPPHESQVLLDHLCRSSWRKQHDLFSSPSLIPAAPSSLKLLSPPSAGRWTFPMTSLPADKSDEMGNLDGMPSLTSDDAQTPAVPTDTNFTS
jgi:hypothetical protein